MRGVPADVTLHVVQLRISGAPRFHVETIRSNATGIVVTSLLLLMKVLPQVPGHFTRYEWIALAVWVGLGLLLRRAPAHD